MTIGQDKRRFSKAHLGSRLLEQLNSIAVQISLRHQPNNTMSTTIRNKKSRHSHRRTDLEFQVPRTMQQVLSRVRWDYSHMKVLRSLMMPMRQMMRKSLTISRYMSTLRWPNKVPTLTHKVQMESRTIQASSKTSLSVLSLQYLLVIKLPRHASREELQQRGKSKSSPRANLKDTRVRKITPQLSVTRKTRTSMMNPRRSVK